MKVVNTLLLVVALIFLAIANNNNSVYAANETTTIEETTTLTTTLTTATATATDTITVTVTDAPTTAIPEVPTTAPEEEEHDHDHDHDHDAETMITPEVWGYSFAATTIVSLLALIGPLVIPCLGRKWSSLILDLLVSLGAGVLLGDAVLHLLPGAFGIHEHEHSEADPHDAHAGEVGAEEAVAEDPLEFFYIALTILASIYVMYVLEKAILPYFGLGHSHEHGEGHGNHHGATTEQYSMKNLLEEIDQEKKEPEAKDTKQEQPQQKQNQHQHEHHHHGKIDASVGWFVIIADLIHNFVDGVAIGASFGSSTATGISTTIAVILHEIPHEVSDFGILIAAGFSKKKTCLLNFLDQFPSFLGVVLGVYLGSDAKSVQYILAWTAGLFIYLSLVDLLPLINYRQGEKAIFLISRNLAFIFGIVIMVCISMIEEFAFPHA